MIWMDVDAALAEVPVNVCPLIDDTDFKTIETAVAYNAAGMSLYWHFVTTAGAYTVTAVTPTTAGTYDWAHQNGGMYSIEIPASGGASINNDTEGFGWFTGVATGVLPWRGPTIGFRAAALNDALIDNAWSTTRGLAGTALPNAAADAAGGLPISDAGGLDLDTFLARLDAAISTRSTYAGADTAGTTTLLTRLTSGRAGNLDNLDATISSIAAAITALNNLSALANLYGSPLLEIPDSGDPDAVYAFTLVVRDNEGKLVALDGAPTITAANAAGTDRSANLSVVSNPATGRYTFTYSVGDTDTPESLRITCSGTVSAEARYVEWVGAVVDYDTLTTLLAVKAKTDLIPAAPASTGDVTSARDSVLTRLGAPAGASVSADIAAVKSDTGNLVSRISATLFSGITSLAQWLGLIAGKQTGNTTARTELRATGAGSGTFDETTDSLETQAERAAAIQAKTDQLTFTVANRVDANASVSLSPEDIDDITAGIIAGLAESGITVSTLTPAALATIRTAVAGAVMSGPVTVGPGADIEVYLDDSYQTANSKPITIDVDRATAAFLAAGDVQLRMRIQGRSATLSGTCVLTSASVATCTFQARRDDWSGMVAGQGEYRLVQLDGNGENQTARRGKATVIASIPA